MIVFFHIEKTAGLTLHWILQSSFGLYHHNVVPWASDKQLFSPKDLSLLLRYFPKTKSIAGHRISPSYNLEEVREDIQYFTFLRNPIRQTASHYQFIFNKYGSKTPSFEDWIKNDWPRNMQTKRISGKADANTALQVIQEKNIFVGLQEQFDESVIMLNSFFNCSLNINYKKVNVAPNNKLAQKLLESESTLQLIHDANTEDLRLYEYVLQKLYPHQKKIYGPSLEGDLAHYKMTNYGFNRTNAVLSRLQRNLVYKPLLYLYRKGIKFRCNSHFTQSLV